MSRVRVGAYVGVLENINRLYYPDFVFAPVLAGPILPELGDFPTLRYLNLGTNQLSGESVSSMLRVTFLGISPANALARRSLYKRNHNFPFPAALRFAGSIPKELGSLSKLKELKLDVN